jgi:hypothetical protein
VLCEKSNQKIITKLAKVHKQDALHLKSVQKLAARFRAEQKDMDDGNRPGERLQTDISNVILRFLENNSHSSSQDVSKALFIPETPIL